MVQIFKVVLKGEASGEKAEVRQPGVVQVQEWNKSERTARALKWGGASFGMAIVTIFLPLLHFILVPGFLIATPIVFFYLLGQEAVILGGEGPCPHCAAPMRIIRSPVKFPLLDMCEKCQQRVIVEIQAG